MLTRELVHYTGQLLEIDRFRDYCPNGLQVAGHSQTHKIISGVSANLALIKAAIEQQADTILVHHGYFWKNEDPCLTGIKRNRLALLLRHNINLLAYHLPLDAHPTLGNNTQLAIRLGLLTEQSFGEQNIGLAGSLNQPQPLAQFADHISHQLNRTPLVIGDSNQFISRIAWCTGGAQHYFNDAIALDVDLYLTGEISEQMVHMAQESGVAFIAAGHHATERYGIQALGEHLAQQFGLTHQFIDIDNPV